VNVVVEIEMNTKYTSNKYYPYSFTLKNKTTYLIWVTNDIDPDKFVTDEKSNLIKSSSKYGINALASKQKYFLIWEEAANMNFDKFWCSLNSLREKRASTNKTCSILLNGWNFIEDLGYTLNMNQVKIILDTPILREVYKKIFYGCNIATIYHDKPYSPLWSCEELHELKEKMRSVWKLLKKYLDEN